MMADPANQLILRTFLVIVASKDDDVVARTIAAPQAISARGNLRLQAFPARVQRIGVRSTNCIASISSGRCRTRTASGCVGSRVAVAALSTRSFTWAASSIVFLVGCESRLDAVRATPKPS
jgi:hypothetical protein